jgi:hypothetical protein
MGLFSKKPKAKAAAKPKNTKPKTKATKVKDDTAARMKKKMAENPDSCPFC